MIIKGQARGGSAQLARHLLRRDHNETVRVHELRGVTASDLPGALTEMEALTAAVPSKRPLYHASISPEAHTPLTDAQIATAVAVLESKLGLGGQPRVVVVHRKKERDHVHVVWSRLDLVRGQTISDGWSYPTHEAAARELEARFGHRVIQGAHGPRPQTRRRTRSPQDYEHRQAERSGRPIADTGAELSALWQASGSAEAFRKMLENAGYTLARGDRRVFVLLDRDGNVHSLARRLGLRSSALAEALAALPLAQLPSVTEARQAQARARHHPLADAFKQGARQATVPVRRRVRVASRHRLARSGTFAVAIGWINGAAGEPQSATPKPMRKIARGGPRFNALRADLVASYAAKIGVAFARYRGEALQAALARLADEQEAALLEMTRSFAADELTELVKPMRRRRVRRRFARARRTLRGRRPPS